MLRRHFLTTGLSLAAASAATRAETGSTLRSVGDSKNLLVGCAVSYRELQDVAYTSIVAEQASILVPENEMKWSIVHPAPERFDFSRADALMKFAAEHVQKVRGHNLCWHNQLPAWFKDIANSQNAADLLKQHIRAVAGRFAGNTHSWDVVNEAINVEDGRPDGLRNSLWLQILGPDYIDIAYRTAAETDAKALLTYNDYDIEQDGPKFDQKRNAVLVLLEGMKRRKIPIHAVGLQSHLKASAKLPDWSKLHEFIAAVERLELDVFITELDVDDSALTGDAAERDQMVSTWYESYLSNVLQQRSVKAVLTWGLTDRDSWLNGPHYRHDGRLRRPLPLDDRLQLKLAYYAMQHAIWKADMRT